MPLEMRDPAYLWDMLDAAASIRQFAQGATFHEYATNKLIRSAVERQLEILGEASRRVSEGFKEAHPEVPWRQIVGLRNLLAHEYGDIQHERVWQIATKNIPALIVQLEPLLPPRP